MSNSYVIRANKLVTVSNRGTIHNGAMVINNGKVTRMGFWKDIKEQVKEMDVINYSNKVVTPSLIDCHTHLLEFAPGIQFPVTESTHEWGAKALLFQALASGVTALGEQICGFPNYDLTFAQLKEWAEDMPLDIRFSLCTISIGFEQLRHFSAQTGSLPIRKDQLANKEILEFLAEKSEYPGENIFINATPANFTEDVVPKAGEVMYTQEELNRIAELYHSKGKRMGAHVGGEWEIDMALNAGIDVLHHAHGMTDSLIDKAVSKNTFIVATPIGGTHLIPNSPEEIAGLVMKGIPVAISTDGFLPPHKDAVWIERGDSPYLGPESLMSIAHPAMCLLKEKGRNENEILALITSNPARIMEMDDRYGQLKEGLDANFIVADGVPGLDVTAPEEIDQVFYQGQKVIARNHD